MKKYEKVVDDAQFLKLKNEAMEAARHVLTGIEALKMLLDGKIVYDVYGREHELINGDILRKYQKLNGKEYYVYCTTQINTFLKQTFYRTKNDKNNNSYIE